jgi:UDP-N-acetylmuramoyl-tripeptide--D-alanyl-D-alanine ligase
MRFRASDVAVAVDGVLRGPDVDIDGVSFDSRTIQPGQLFVPLVAERDGHDFIDAALERGAAAYLTRLGHQGGTAVDVDDTLQALMDLARARRWHFHGLVVGVTGSVGKTSTKDLARAALAAGGLRTWANERSFNNDQGLPTALLNAPDDAEVMVLEMGMRGFGEIERLCGIAQPHVGIVTAVGEAHADRVGGLDGVAIAKGELVRALPDTGTAILNADDPRVLAMRQLASGAVVTYGEADDADVRISGVTLDELARASFRLDSPWGSADVWLAVSGAHMVSNAAAALACAGVAGGDVQAAAAGLCSASASAMRMEMVHTVSGALVINDAYNANPTSMRAALDTLAALPAERRVAVLGVMAEITEPERQHLDIADHARELGIHLVTSGTALYGVAPSGDPLAAVGSLASGDAILVKASRDAGFERIAGALVAAGGGRTVVEPDA